MAIDIADLQIKISSEASKTIEVLNSITVVLDKVRKSSNIGVGLKNVEKALNKFNADIAICDTRKLREYTDCIERLSLSMSMLNRSTNSVKLPKVSTPATQIGANVASGTETVSLVGGKVNAPEKLRLVNEQLGDMSKKLKEVGRASSESESKSSKLFSSIKRIAAYRLIRTAISGITNGLKEGIANLYQFSKAYDSTFSKSLDEYKTSTTYFKNSFATAIAPALNALIPLVTYLADKTVDIINSVNETVARLTGASEWTKAIKYQTEFAEATAEAANAQRRLLSGFDEINTLTGNSSSALDYTKMFETVKTDLSTTEGFKSFSNDMKSFASDLKSLWGDIKVFVNNAKTQTVTLFNDVIKPAYNDFLKPLYTDVLKPLYNDILKPLFFENALPAFNGEVSSANRVLKTAFELLGSIAKSLGTILDCVIDLTDNVPLFGGVMGDLGATLNPVAMILNGVANLFTVLDIGIEGLAGTLKKGEVAEKLADMYESLALVKALEHIGVDVTLNADEFQRKLDNIKTDVVNFFDNIKTDVVNFFDNIKAGFNGMFDKIKIGIVDLFGGNDLSTNAKLAAFNNAIKSSESAVTDPIGFAESLYNSIDNIRQSEFKQSIPAELASYLENTSELIEAYPKLKTAILRFYHESWGADAYMQANALLETGMQSDAQIMSLLESRWGNDGTHIGLEDFAAIGIESGHGLTSESANTLLEYLRLMGSVTGLGGLGVPVFATGGFPEDGLFYANHNELVGQFSNGRNVVANNQQIVEGIAQGVRMAMSESSGGDWVIQIVDNSGRVLSEERITAMQRRNSRDGKTIVPLRG